MKKMLIDAAHAEETRVVLIDGSRIDDFESETQGKQQHKGNIYVGTVSRVEPSLQAAFITYGGNRNGFLAFGEVHPQFFSLKAAEKAALMEELADQAARRRTEDEETTEHDGMEVVTPRHHRRERPQRVATQEPVSPASEAAEATEVSEVPSAPLADMPFYEDPEDAAAAQKAAAMADAMEGGASEGNAASTKRQAGRGRPATNGKRGGANGTGRRPKRLNARRPVRTTEATAEGLAEEEPTSADIAADIKATPKPNAKQGSKPNKPARGKKTPQSAAPEAVATEGVATEPMVAERSENPERAKVSGISHGSVHRRYRINDVLKEGQKILVQVVKEERGSKGAALTSYISLPGRYTVLMPNTPNAGGISRKITDADERRMLRETYKALNVPATMGLIIRTAGHGQEIDAIKADYSNLQQLWSHITTAFEGAEDVQCLHEDGSIIVRALRDMAGDDVEEILISGQRAYKQAKDFAKAFMPETLKKISLYKEEAPIFSHHKVESKLIQLHHERVQLPSGGSIVINPTEALVAIDINSGRNTSERNIEETAYKTNLEACEEIARQIRLRDLAGLIVVDFIDMENYGNTRKIEQAMRRALKRDRARIQGGSISEFGLMEISRQRLRPSFAENHTVKCAHCGGTGRMISPSSAGLMLLRRLEEDDATGSDRITASAATPTVMWVLNHKRDLIRTLEEKYKFQLLFKADDTLLAPDARLELTRMKADGEATQTVNVEWREQAEVPPEKRYTKEGRAQRQREEEAREELRQHSPEPAQKAENRAPRDTAEPKRQDHKRPERPARVETDKASVTPEVAKAAEPKAQPKATVKPAKRVVEVADAPLAVEKVVAERDDAVVITPKAKPKMAIKMQADTDRDVSPIAVAKVEAESGSTSAAKPSTRKKASDKPASGILNRLLGL